MHVEPLEKLPRSVREFLSHYSMIVLSILTALALEQVALGIEHRHQGERARQEIAQEVDANRRAVEDALADTRRNVDVWEALLARTVDDVRAGTSTDERLIATLEQARKNFRDSTPALTTGAWDAAISSHAVDYLSHDELRSFSELYAAQRDFTQSLWRIVQDSALRSLSELSTPGLLGKADPTATIELLNARRLTLHVMVSQLSQMDDSLRKTLHQPDAAAPAAPAASVASDASSAASAH